MSLYLSCEGRFLEVENPFTVDPHYCPAARFYPFPTVAPLVRPHPPPFLSTDEQPLANNTQIFTILQFFQAFWKFWHFWFFSALEIKETLLGFYNRLLHSF